MNDNSIIWLIGGAIAAYFLYHKFSTVPVAVANPLVTVQPTQAELGVTCIDTGQCGPGQVFGPTAWKTLPGRDVCQRGPGGFCVAGGSIDPSASYATACGCSQIAMAL